MGTHFTRWQNDLPLAYTHYHVAHRELPFLAGLQESDPKRARSFCEANVLDVDQLPLATFPLIEDFVVLLEGVVTDHQYADGDMIYWIQFFSPSRGYLARIGSETLQRVCQDDFVVPSGGFHLPYAEIWQRWRILLAENDEWVYILTDEEALEDGGYTTWFKVEKARYYSPWEKTIHQCSVLLTSAQRG